VKSTHWNPGSQICFYVGTFSTKFLHTIKTRSTNSSERFATSPLKQEKHKHDCLHAAAAGRSFCCHCQTLLYSKISLVTFFLAPMTTLAQQKAVAIAPKITAFASILGSSTAAFLVWKRDTNKTTYHRLVLGMSIVDLIASIAWFFTTWRKCRGFASLYSIYHYWIAAILLTLPFSSIHFVFISAIPRGTPGVYGAVGNQQTCSAQAFFAQFSLSTVMYNASLAVYYVLVIVKKKSDNQIARIEPWLHANAIAWGLGTGIGGLSLEVRRRLLCMDSINSWYTHFHCPNM